MNNKKGFTLVELMVVVGLIAILLTVILGSVRGNKMKSRDNVRISHIQELRLALEAYRSTCQVFPRTLSLTENNSRRPGVDCDAEFGDFIGTLPVAPTREGSSLLLGDEVPNAANYSGYFYIGLSTNVNGPCYEYHIGTELEFAEDNGENSSSFLNEDHDFTPGDGDFGSRCGPTADFGDDPDSDDEQGLYDFRSTKSQ